MLKKLSFTIVLFFILNLTFFTSAFAQENNPLLTAEINPINEEIEATESAEATESTSLASPSAEVQEKIKEKQDKDITETGGQQKSKLAKHLDDNPPGPLSWNNFLQHAIRETIAQGIPANVLVLVLLFPLVASFIASSRHIIGLRGFGIYIPAVLSVALVSTGVVAGLIMFAAIVVTALIAKRILSRFRLPYLPRTALTLWGVSLGILGLFIVAPILNITSLMIVNIFPILILVLLGQNFLDAQVSTKQSDALALTIETLVLAFISSILLQWEFLQKLALLEPELLLISTAILNFVVGRFTGLRLAEWLRFRPIIEE
ncbi:MAG: 7TM domain-containing protein [Patescibacteria group bacterium]